MKSKKWEGGRIGTDLPTEMKEQKKTGGSFGPGKEDFCLVLLYHKEQQFGFFNKRELFLATVISGRS